MAKLYPYLLCLFVFLLVFVGYFHRITAFTQDLGRHILLGKIIFTTRTIPDTNLLSYTYPTFPFLNHHYLSEVFFYLIYESIGTTGLLLLTTIIMLVAVGFVFLFAFKRTGVAACIAALLLLPILFERTDIRPEIVSFLLFAIFTTLLFRYKERPTMAVFLLPLLMLLWVNLHIYFFTGIVLVALFLLDGVVSSRRNIWCRYNRALAVVFFLSLLATLLNPHTLQGALYPLSALRNYGYTIEENQTIFLLESLGFQKTSVTYFKISVFLLFFVLLFNIRKTRPIDWLLTLTFSIAGAVAVRNLPLFTLASLIPFATNLSPFLKRFSLLFKESPIRRRLLITHAVFLILICFALWQIVATAQKNEFGYKEDPGAVKGVDFFITHNLQGPLLNNFDIGSYLAYRLYPKERVFVDGRPEAYPAAFFKETYIPLQEDPSVFARVDKQYGFNTIFLSHTDQTPWAQTFLVSMLQNPLWKPVYLDQTVIIFVKNTPQNAVIIKQFGMDPENLKASNVDSQDKRYLLQLISLYSVIGQTDTLFQLLQQLLVLDPKNCQALYYRGAIAQERQDPLTTSYILSYERTCKKSLSQL